MNARPSLDDESCGTLSLADRRVRRLGFGAMRVSNARGADGARDRDAARSLVRRAVERGVNFIDTADIYGLGQSEEIIGEVLAPYSRDLLVATKVGFEPRRLRTGETVLPARGHPDHIKAQCERSLVRLQVDHIDLYQVHVPDPEVPWSDTVGAFADLQRAGKVRAVGVSNVSVEQLAEARTIVDVVSVQNRFNAGDHASDAVLEVCERDGVAFLPYRPLLVGEVAAGVLSRVAARHGIGTGQVALAWLLARSPAILAIPGTSRIEHLDENIDAAWVSLDHDDLAILGELGHPGPQDDAGTTDRRARRGAATT